MRQQNCRTIIHTIIYAILSTVTLASCNQKSFVAGSLASTFTNVTSSPTPTPPVTQTLPLPGTLSLATKLSVPTTVANLTKDPYVIAGYLDVTKYGADSTGIKDSSLAFQNAMNDAAGNATGSGGNSMVVYVPQGTYLISKAITGIQTFNRTNSNFGALSHYGGLLAPSLVGNPVNPPTIVLKDNSSGFTNANNPQPIIRIVNSPNAGPGGCGAQWQNSTSGCWDVLFNAVVRDINIRTGNNPGAIGVQFYSAQKSYMQNVSVNAIGGYAGIQGAPATDAWVNISVTGGQYGLMVDTGSGTNAVVGLTLTNQSVAGIYFTNLAGDLAITGFNIQETASAATAIRLTNAIAQGTALSLVDGIIVTASTTQPAIDNLGGDSIYINNTYLQSSSGQTIVNKGSTTVAGNGQLQLFREYAHADQATASSYAGLPYKYALACYIVINDAKQKTDYGPIYGGGAAPPNDLVLRHVPHMPWAFDSNTVWVTDYGADPTGFSDSTVSMQNAINLAHTSGSDEVFLPRGNYSMSGTLHLYANTKFFGIPGSYAQLQAYGWVTNNKLQPFLQVGDAINDGPATKVGTAIVSDITFFMPVNSVQFPEYAKLLPNGGANYNPTDQTYLYAIDWQAGANSIMNQVSISFMYNEIKVNSPASRNFIQVDHSGGGRWYGLQIAGDWGPNGANGYSLYTSGTSSPLTLYGSNPEHSNGIAFYGFANSSNIRVLGLKMESGGNKYLFQIINSNNIMLGGLGNHGQYTISSQGNSNNLNFNTAIFYTGPGTDPAFFINLDTNVYYTFADAYALFKVGNFDSTVFPTCSTGLNCN